MKIIIFLSAMSILLVAVTAGSISHSRRGHISKRDGDRGENQAVEPVEEPDHHEKKHGIHKKHHLKRDSSSTNDTTDNKYPEFSTIIPLSEFEDAFSSKRAGNKNHHAKRSGDTDSTTSSSTEKNDSGSKDPLEQLKELLDKLEDAINDLFN